VRTTHLDARVVVSKRESTRVGFVVPKHGESSVRRNRLKRYLREHTRRELLIALRALTKNGGVDVVVRARPEAYRATFDALRPDFTDLGAQITRLLTASRGRIDRGGSDTPRAGRP
jgi:ribonuclease P protein component